MSRSLRVFPVDADRDLGGALRLGAQVLAAGDTLVWFAEGRRSLDGELQRFRPGVGVLLERVPVPVIPVRIEGTFAAWPPQRRWTRFRPLSVTFGTACSPDWLRERGDGEQAASRISDALEQTVAALQPVADSTDRRDSRRA